MKPRYFLAAVVCVFAAPVIVADVNAAETEIACGTPDQELKRLSAIPPRYPYAAVWFCIEGHARFEYTVNPDGTTSDIELLESVPEGVFSGTGEVIRFWTHEPACRDGEAVASKSTTELEFWLEDLDVNRCPENLPDDLLDVQVALFSLHQQTDAAARNQSSPLTPMPVESALEEPFASIERAHRRHLNDRLALAREWRMYSLRSVISMVGPENLTTQHGFSTAREVLDIFESGRHEVYWKWPTIAKTFRQELADVAAMEGVTPEVYALLLEDRLAQPEDAIAPPHDLMALEASVFSAHRELLDWLESHSHEWDVVNSEFRFASDGLAEGYQQRIDGIQSLWQTWDREFNMPRRMHWSGF